MKLVIDISDHTYATIKNGGTVWSHRICNSIRNGTSLTEWLNSFDTNSATKCFEAVNLLKQRLEGEE